MAVSAAGLMTTSVLQGRGATTNLATLLLPPRHSNERHQIDKLYPRSTPP